VFGQGKDGEQKTTYSIKDTGKLSGVSDNFVKAVIKEHKTKIEVL
jgi:hypothetical protein